MRNYPWILYGIFPGKIPVSSSFETALQEMIFTP